MRDMLLVSGAGLRRISVAVVVQEGLVEIYRRVVTHQTVMRALLTSRRGISPSVLVAVVAGASSDAA